MSTGSPPASRTALVRRARRMGRILEETYPTAHCELDYENPLQLLEATILSAQCTDVKVNEVTATLFVKYRTPEDYLRVPEDELRADIKPTGFYNQKAASIRATCARLIEVYDGQVPDTMEELQTLRGVARKTANVVLGTAYRIPVGIATDTHVMRVSQKLGLTTATKPEKIEQDLMKLFATANWAMASHWLIWHGRRRCSARKPDCDSCEIAALCPSGLTQRNGNS